MRSTDKRGLLREVCPYFHRIACGAQKYGLEALAMPSRRRDAAASIDVGAKGVGMLRTEAGRS
jgi:hypothetical protein